MPKPYFQFKQFTVWHEQCAMKVNTDGILLGAWANIDGDTQLLDVGTGSGLIALMLAQRSHDDSSLCPTITAIDIEPNAVKQSTENFIKSPWAERLSCVKGDVLQFEFNRQFDHIVSNPPYFSHSLKNPAPSKRLARHQDSLTANDLLNIAHKLTTSAGKLSLILPSLEMAKVLSVCQALGWFPARILEVYHNDRAQAEPLRLLVELRKSPVESVVSQELAIRDKNGNYSMDYKALCRNYYLKF